jgi:aminoglycoside 3-N-acetyltransferase
MKEQMIRDLRALGVREGGALLVHTAFSSLGGIAPGEAIDALLAALGEEGTLVLPALSYGNITRESPAFDVAATPSCVGFLPEYFRAQVSGVARSVHPTHSCCAKGVLADSFTRDHHLDHTPVGPNSPFSKLRDAGGKILFLGCGTRPNTSMHGVEELALPDYLFGEPCTYHISDETGTYEKKYETHGFRGVRQRYDRLEALLAGGEIARGKVLRADCVLMDARAAWEKGYEALKRDPHCFVEPD